MPTSSFSLGQGTTQAGMSFDGAGGGNFGAKFSWYVEAVQRKGVRVSVVSTVSTQPAMVADELRRQADEFIDLVTLMPRIGRDPSERAARLSRAAHAYGAPGSPMTAPVGQEEPVRE